MLQGTLSALEQLCSSQEADGSPMPGETHVIDMLISINTSLFNTIQIYLDISVQVCMQDVLEK